MKLAELRVGNRLEKQEAILWVQKSSQSANGSWFVRGTLEDPSGAMGFICFNADSVARIKELTEGRGADVFYDPVGGELFDASLRSIAFEGRILAIGFASGTVPQIPANHLLVKNVDVIGVNWPAYAELNPEVMTASFQTLMQWYLAGAIKPHVSAIYPLAQSAEALDRVVSRKATGKIVIAMD